jgi:hypothetical protein
MEVRRRSSGEGSAVTPGEAVGTFLDDSLLPSTSNAVERGNRRHRKMQKSVYSVRTHQAVTQRMALDLLREQRFLPRALTLRSLHLARAG